MKKFLLSMAAVLGLGMFTSAQTVLQVKDVTNIQGEHHDAQYNEDGSLKQGENYQPIESFDLGDLSFSFTLSEEAANEKNNVTEPALYVSDNTIRVYNYSIMTITAPEGKTLTQIDFAGSKGTKDQAPTVSTGAVSGVTTSAMVWTGSASTISFTYTVSFRISKMTVYYSGEEPEPEPDPEVTYAQYDKATVAEAGDFVFVCDNKVATTTLMVGSNENENYGYMQTVDVTITDGSLVANKAYQLTLAAVDGGFTIKDSKGYLYSDGSHNTISRSAELPETGAVWALTVQDDGTMKIVNVATSRWIQFDSQYTNFGCYAEEKGSLPTLYKYVKDVEGEPEPDPEPTTTSVTALNQLANIANNEAITMDVDLTTVYVNGSYVYVTDGSNYGLIYKKNLGLEAGKVVAKGWTGKVSIYKNLIEIVPDDATLAASGTAEIPEPVEVDEDTASTSIVAANQNCYIMLLDVTFAEATPAADATSETLEDGTKVDHREFTGSMGDTEIVFYQRFGVESVPAGKYNVVGFISVYGDVVQVLPIKYEALGGIEGIEADADAPVLYYNIQGMRIDNPVDGQIYIRVQGRNASKVIF